MNFNGELYYNWGFIPGSIIIAGDLDIKGRLLLSDGTSGSPSLTFASLQSMGLYKSGASEATWIGGTFKTPVGLVAGPTTVSSLVSTGTGSFGTNAVTMSTVTIPGINPLTINSTSGAAGTASWPVNIEGSGISNGALFGMGINRGGTGPSLLMGTNKTTATDQVPGSYSFISNYSNSNGLTLGRGGGNNLPSFADIKIDTTGAVSMTNGQTSVSSLSSSGNVEITGPGSNGSGFRPLFLLDNAPQAGNFNAVSIQKTGYNSVSMGVAPSTGYGQIPASGAYFSGGASGTLSLGRGDPGGFSFPYYQDIAIDTKGAVSMTNGNLSLSSLSTDLFSAGVGRADIGGVLTVGTIQPKDGLSGTIQVGGDGGDTLGYPFFIGDTGVTTKILSAGVSRVSGDGNSVFMGMNKDSSTGEVAAAEPFIQFYPSLAIGRSDGTGFSNPLYKDIGIASDGSLAMTNGGISTQTISASSQSAYIFTTTTDVQSIPNNSVVTVQNWDTTAVKAQGAAVTCDGSNFVIPTEGWWQCGMGTRFSTSSSAGIRRVFMLLSGDGKLYGDNVVGGAGYIMNATSSIFFTAGQQITLQCYQNSGGALDIGGSADALAIFYQLP